MTTARDALAVRLAAAAGVADGERTEELERLVTQLFEELGRPVLRYIRGFVRDGAVARDLTQEVFVRLCVEHDPHMAFGHMSR
jgi:Sigma-70 region 2